MKHIFQNALNTIRTTSFLLYLLPLHVNITIQAVQELWHTRCLLPSFPPAIRPSFLPSYFLPSWTQVHVLQLQLPCTTYLLRPSVKRKRWRTTGIWNKILLEIFIIKLLNCINCFWFDFNHLCLYNTIFGIWQKIEYQRVII